MNDTAPLIRFNDVEKTYFTEAGPFPVLHNIDVSIRRGDFVALTGPSGSGKTTFLNLAGMLDLPTQGAIEFEGNTVSQLAEPALCEIRKRKIGMVFQAFHLLMNRSVLDNVLFRFRYTDTAPQTANQLSSNALDLVGLRSLASKPVRLLSGGEMQRVAIARAVASNPDLILADEPTGNLDIDASTTIMNYLAELHRKGITILLATHNPGLLRYCTRHMEFQKGAIQETGKNLNH